MEADMETVELFRAYGFGCERGTSNTETLLLLGIP